MQAAPISEPGSRKGLDVIDGPDGPAALANFNDSSESDGLNELDNFHCSVGPPRLAEDQRDV